MYYDPNGVIWCVSDEANGGRRYFDQAVLSAQSFKQHNPKIKTAIFRDDESLHDPIFDYHLPVHRTEEEKKWTMRYLHEWSPTKRTTNLKVLCSSRSPFYKTLYLDADTYVLTKIDEVFDFLDHYSILFTNADRVKRNSEGVNVGCTELTAKDQANSGVYAFRKDPGAMYVLGEQWVKFIEERKLGEQAVQTLYIREPEKYMLGIEWAFLDNVIYNAQRRMWSSMHYYGLWDEAKILHSGNFRAFQELHDGKISKNDLLGLDDVKSCDPRWVSVKPRTPNKKHHDHSDTCPFCSSELDTSERRNCRKCNTSDRNRSLKQLYDALELIIKPFTCLNLSADKVILGGNYFSNVENSIFQAENHIDIQKINKNDDAWDFIVCNHILEHVKNDKSAIIELMRTARKVVQITVPVTTRVVQGLEYGKADPSKYGHYRHYGSDFAIRTKKLIAPCRVLVVVLTDKFSGNYEISYLLVKDLSLVERIFIRLRDQRIPCIVI